MKKLALKQYDWYYVVAYVGEKRIPKAFPNARFIGWCLGKALFYVGDDTNIPIDEEDLISVKKINFKNKKISYGKRNTF